MVIVLLVITAKWELSKCLSTDKWVNGWYSHAMEYLIFSKKKEKNNDMPNNLDQGCPTFWHLWATMEEELSWATH